MIKNALFAVSVFQLLALNAGYELYVADSCSPFSADGKYNEYAYVGYDWSESFWCWIGKTALQTDSLSR